MAGDADDAPQSEHAPRLVIGCVLLPDVDAVAAGGERQVGPVVHHEQRIVLVAQRAQPPARRHDLLVGPLLLAKLDEIHPAAQGGLHHRVRGTAVHLGIDHEIQVRTAQTLAPALAIRHALNPIYADRARRHAGAGLPGSRC